MFEWLIAAWHHVGGIVLAAAIGAGHDAIRHHRGEHHAKLFHRPEWTRRRPRVETTDREDDTVSDWV